MPIFYVKETLAISYPHTHRCIAVIFASRSEFETRMANWNSGISYRYVEVPESCLNRLFTPKQIRYMGSYGGVEWPNDK